MKRSVPSEPRRLDGKTCTWFVFDPVGFGYCNQPGVVYQQGWKCREHAPKPAEKGKR